MSLAKKMEINGAPVSGVIVSMVNLQFDSGRSAFNTLLNKASEAILTIAPGNERVS